MKVSYRQLNREASKLLDDNTRLKKEMNGIIKIMFGFAVKLYKLSPEDDSFKSLQPEFMDNIKKAASKP